MTSPLPSTHPPQSWRFAVCTQSLRHLDPAETAAAVRAAGYEGMLARIDTPLDDPETAAFVKRLTGVCDREGLSITGLACDPDPITAEHIGRAVALARSMGARHLRVRPARLQPGTYQTAIEATVRLCEAYVTAAASSGVRVVVQQHWGTVAPSATQLFNILSPFDARDIGCIYDAGSMLVEGYEHYRIGLEFLGAYVADVHVKNVRFFASESGVWDWEWSGLNDGLIDLRALFGALRGAGYRGWITLADESGYPDRIAMLRTSQALLAQAVRES
jgi:sugar phosphate isomerase/epimerase